MSDDPTRLLGEGDPPPVRVLRPTGASEFFLTGDHAGRAIPRHLDNLGLPGSELERHIAWDIGIGILYSRDARLAHIMLDLLRAEGDLAVGDNAPYAITEASDYTVPMHGERGGLAHVEIEIRQDLIGDEPGQAAWAARLARLLPIADARLCAADGASHN